jgi:RNA 3'-terminal phosphate cyclase (ATP)
MALAGGGKFRTLSPTRHTTTNAEIIKKFIDVDIAINEYEQNRWEIELWNG